MNIKTEHVYPPIPHRGNDWCAWIEDSDEETRICGWGATEEDAITDLRMLLDDDNRWEDWEKALDRF